MKFFEIIAKGKSTKHRCMDCKHFQNEPAFIEKIYPGLTSMSSGYASVRDMDGFCEHNQRYLSARDSCTHFSDQSRQIETSVG